LKRKMKIGLCLVVAWMLLSPVFALPVAHAQNNPSPSTRCSTCGLTALFVTQQIEIQQEVPFYVKGVKYIKRTVTWKATYRCGAGHPDTYVYRTIITTYKAPR